METSDSDYFESADEDFYTDDDANFQSKGIKIRSDVTCSRTDKIKQVSVRRVADYNDRIEARIKEAQQRDDIANIPHAKEENESTAANKKCKKESVLCTKENTSDKKNESSSRTHQTNLKIDKRRETQRKVETIDEQEIDSAIESQLKINNIWGNNNWDDIETTSTGKLINKTSSKPKTDTSIVVKTVETVRKTEDNMWDDDDDDWNEIETMIKNESKTIIKKPESGKPVARVAWMPGVTNAPTIEATNASLGPSINKERPEFDSPAARVDCWEDGVNTVTNFMKDVSKKSTDNSIQVTEKVPESQEPSDKASSWEKDVNIDCPLTQHKSGGKPFFGTIGDAKKAAKQKPDIETPTTKDDLNDPQNLNDSDKCEEKEENMWEDDEWEPLEVGAQHPNDPHHLNEAKDENSTWGSWGNWGISSVISKATTLTSHMSQGLSTVLESGIGALDPEELARINKLEREQLRETQPEDLLENKSNAKIGFDLGNFVQGVTKLVETTGNKVITGGLDTLETIGKKTMEVLQENDPGLKKKRAFLKIDDNKPVLSQVLREAKEKAEEDNKKLEEKQFARKANYETLFDDHQGLVHLEALEMLSKQCDMKLQSLLESSSGNALTEIQETMDQVKELCELPDEDEDETLSSTEIKEKLELAVCEININITYNRLIKLWDEVEDWLNNVNLNICNERELHQQAIETLAQLTAMSVEQFHKSGELLLVKDRRSTADEADSLVQLTTTLTTLIGIAAAKFSEKLNVIAADGGNKENINGLITNVFFEAANSSSYIQDAFQLLIPVLQVGAV